MGIHNSALTLQNKVKYATNQLKRYYYFDICQMYYIPMGLVRDWLQ